MDRFASPLLLRASGLAVWLVLSAAFFGVQGAEYVAVAGWLLLAVVSVAGLTRPQPNGDLIVIGLAIVLIVGVAILGQIAIDDELTVTNVVIAVISSALLGVTLLLANAVS